MENEQNQDQNGPSKYEQHVQKREAKEAAKNRAKTGKKAKSIITWLVVILIVIAAVWGLIIIGKSGPAGGGDLGNLDLTNEWVKGASEAKVTLVEFSDFQCPACRSFHPVVQDLLNEFPNDLQLVYKHFPLTRIHPNAEPAAYAAEAAGLQGRFYEYHDRLFLNQDAWANERDPKESFVLYAQSMGLDIEKFESDYESDAVRNAVDEDYRAGISAAVNSTPTFYLNGEKLTNPRTYDDFKALVESAISGDTEMGADSDTNS